MASDKLSGDPLCAAEGSSFTKANDRQGLVGGEGSVTGRIGPESENEDMQPQRCPLGGGILEEDGIYSTKVVGAEGAHSVIRVSGPAIPVAEERRTCATPWCARFADGNEDFQFDDEDAEVRGFSNRIKGAIEDHLGVPMSWWPLSPRLNPLPDGSSRIRWKCHCGKSLWDVISAADRAELEQWLSTQSPSANPAGDQASPATGG